MIGHGVFSIFVFRYLMTDIAGCILGQKKRCLVHKKKLAPFGTGAEKPARTAGWSLSSVADARSAGQPILDVELRVFLSA